jgi:hypothetical protein
VHEPGPERVEDRLDQQQHVASKAGMTDTAEVTSLYASAIWNTPRKSTSATSRALGSMWGSRDREGDQRGQHVPREDAEAALPGRAPGASRCQPTQPDHGEGPGHAREERDPAVLSMDRAALAMRRGGRRIPHLIEEEDQDPQRNHRQ